MLGCVAGAAGDAAPLALQCGAGVERAHVRDVLECVGGDFAVDARGGEVVGAQSERWAALAHGATVRVDRCQGGAMVRGFSGGGVGFSTGDCRRGF